MPVDGEEKQLQANKVLKKDREAKGKDVATFLF